MKIQQTPRDDHQMEVVVELENEQLDTARRRAARKISEKAKIPGFRPGKAPYPVVLRHYGEAAITEEAVELLVDEVYPKMLEEAKISPAAAGALENVEKLDPPTFKFLVPLAPTVDLGDYRSIRLAYEWQAPGEDKVDESIEQLREMYSSTETVEREVREGDFVMLDVHGALTKKAAAPVEGQAAVDEVDLSRDGYPVFVRKDENPGDWPFPGFSGKLVGSNPGEELLLTHKYPKDAPDESLRGKAAKFAVTVKTVRGVTLPELDDEFARKVGAGETVDELRERVRQNIERQSREEYDDKYFVELFDQIKHGATIKYPPQMLEHEAEHVREELERRLSEQHMDLETYLKVRETDMDTFLAEEIRPSAQRRLERSLLIDEIARQEKIELSEEELSTAFQQNWAALSASDEQFQKLTKGGTRANKDMVNAVVMDAANRTIVSRVLDHLKAIATGQAESGAAAVKAKPKKKSAKKKVPKEDESPVEPEAEKAE